MAVRSALVKSSAGEALGRLVGRGLSTLCASLTIFALADGHHPCVTSEKRIDALRHGQPSLPWPGVPESPPVIGDEASQKFASVSLRLALV